MLEILIGPICSGKSTYARKRASDGAIIVNDDAITQALHGGNYSLYAKGLKALYKSVENLIVTQAITLGRDVVIDRPNMSRSNRQRFLGIARSLDEQVTAIVFPNRGPEAQALRRFNQDPRGLPLEHWVGAAMRHQSNYEEPTLVEGFMDIIPVEDVPVESIPVS